MSDRGNQNDKATLAHHVRVDLSEARVDRAWDRVSERLAAPRRTRAWLWSSVMACAATAGAITIAVLRANSFHAGGPPVVASVSAWEGAQLETAADALSVSLVDGSSLKVEPRSRVEVRNHAASALKLVLAHGRIACDVTHREGRSFVVAAGGVEVRVVGTRFSVANEAAEGGTRVEVRVERGIVEVRGAGPDAEVVRVEAGHSWSQLTKTEALAAPEAEAPALAPAPEGQSDDQPEPAAPAKPRLTAHAARPPATDARELFEQARGQWRAGKIEEAARTYQSLLTAHPRDPRAGLAAFELGRLRMDRLNDMPGAVQALEQAVALAPGAELREDALARLVAASAGAHDRARCARSRSRYLTEYPSGVHHRTVSAAACD